MKLAVVSRHLPQLDGTAAGRVLLATCDGLLAEGHDVAVWSWGPEEPSEPLPPWCDWRPLLAKQGLGRHVAGLVRPRADVGRAGWSQPDDAVGVADDPVSFAALAASRPSVVTFHYWPRLDARALRRLTPAVVQDERAWRRAYRHATVSLAYSERVAGAAGPRARPVPAAISIPPEALPVIDEPVAGLLADWSWPPNRHALGRLVDAWPRVRERVAGAKLVLAGRGLERSSERGGIEILGPVSRSTDALSRFGLVVFPSPDTSGPKVKVLEAMAYGLPVLTTPSGTEGVVATPDRDLVVSRDIESALVSLLNDPATRARLGAAGRAAVAAAHAPRPAARARISALSDLDPAGA